VRRWPKIAMSPSGCRERHASGSLNGPTEQIAFRNSRYNRVGGPLKISLHLLVCDGALHAWRAEHLDIALHADDILIAHPLGYVAGRAHGRVYGSWEDGVLDLAEPTQRAARVTATTGMLRNSILPLVCRDRGPGHARDQGPGGHHLDVGKPDHRVAGKPQPTKPH
jgi:hypothetical protein